MIFDSLVMAAVYDELARALVGSKVERITQPAALEVVITLYQHQKKSSLLLSADPQEARVHLTAVNRENPLKPPAFCMLLRKRLLGAWITDISMPYGLSERILHVTFHAHEDGVFTLIAEVMGKYSNIVLTHSNGMILGSIKIVTGAINRVREVRPGVIYAPPPPQKGKLDPLGHFDPASAPPFISGDEAAWLTSTFSGVSPLLAKEAVLRAHSPWTPETLWYGLNEIVTAVRIGDFAPRVWTNDDGTVAGAYPIALRSVPGERQSERPSISTALEEAVTSWERRDTVAHAQEALLAALHRTIKTRGRERDDAEKGLANAQRADEYQQAGELLLAHPTLVASGSRDAVLPDYFAPLTASGAPPLRAISLDPALDVRANAERYFKKARKARDSREVLENRLATLTAEAALLEQVELEARAAHSHDQIAAIRERVASALVPTQKSVIGEPASRQAPPYEGHKIRTFRSPDGWEILVGENATANDYLTTRVAAPSDIWLHVRAGASAHGVIRAGNRPAAVSPAALQQAAELVAARSEVKHSSLIAVDYTLKKYVRKPRKSAPGAVTYQNEKTLTVSGISGE